jgi:three-Cys-motif partner protein
MATPRRRRARIDPDEGEYLFELPAPRRPDKSRVRELPLYPLWTENKAKLIERYLYYFVLVTKHGTYIDGFAGPQRSPDNWAARLVLENEPPRLRHFHLCEVDRDKVKRLRELRDQHPDRGVEVYHGDFNKVVDRILLPEVIGEKEATFCLLDQWTFECDWATVQRIARFKTGRHRIEIFYFLANWWFSRALKTSKSDRPGLWWGRDDVAALADLRGIQRAEVLCQRFRDELGYASARPWAIYDRENGRRVMYYMIHATDHPKAPELMSRAYEKAVLPKEQLYRQLRLTDRIRAKSSSTPRRRGEGTAASGPTRDRPAGVPQPSGSVPPTA